MNVLLDSHALLWALHDPGHMRPAAATVISDPTNAVFFSAATAWEMELKAAKGKLALPEEWLETAEQAGFRHLPVTARAAQASTRLRRHHTDPFDRMLVAQAQEHGLTIATRDPLILQYGVPVLEV